VKERDADADHLSADQSDFPALESARAAISVIFQNLRICAPLGGLVKVMILSILVQIAKSENFDRFAAGLMPVRLIDTCQRASDGDRFRSLAFSPRDESTGGETRSINLSVVFRFVGFSSQLESALSRSAR